MMVPHDLLPKILAEEFAPPPMETPGGIVEDTDKETFTREEVEALIDVKTKEIIETMRTKEESEVNDNGKGKDDTGNE